MWESKHKPTTWQSYVGNSAAVQQCKDWMKNFQMGAAAPDTPRILIISGPEGCGKSLAADLLLRKQGYQTFSFGVKEIKKHKGDKNCLDNFCNLYMSDLRVNMGSAANGKARRQAHGIILEDFDGLTRSDKKFNAALIDLIKRRGSSVTPLIITTAEGNLSKQSGGLVRLASVVYFQKLSHKDLVKIAQHVAEVEGLYLNDDHAEMFATNARGDVRQLLLSMEMFYSSKKGGLLVTSSEVAAYMDDHGVDSDGKVCSATGVGVLAAQTDDERILGIAIGDRGDKYTMKERSAAYRLISDNSMQFSPYLFQTYLKCLPSSSSCAIEVATLASDEMSEADVVRDALWSMDGYHDVYGTLALEVPIKRIRVARDGDEDTRNFRVDITGYQTFYGVENTLNTQSKLYMRLHELNPTFAGSGDVASIELMKELYKNALDTMTDEQIIEMIYPIHPEYLELFAKIKSDVGASSGTTSKSSKRNVASEGGCDYTITKARMKKLVKCYDEQMERCKPTVKFIDPSTMEAKRKRQEAKGLLDDPNDKFVVTFD